MLLPPPLTLDNFEEERYRSLWANVLSSATSDVLTYEEPALRWFLTPPRKDFHLVCALAGRDPTLVRRKLSSLVLAQALLVAEHDVIAEYDRAALKVVWATPSRGTWVFASRFLYGELAKIAKGYAGAMPTVEHARHVVVETFRRMYAA